MPKSGDGTPCSECGSNNTVKNGIVTTKRGKMARRKCKNCGNVWYPKRQQKRACVCGLIDCDCGGNLGQIITYAQPDEYLRAYKIDGGYTLNLNAYRK